MNKGFTLVELIAVISLISILVIITTPAYNTISKTIKKRNYESKQNTIEKQTLSYVEKYLKDEVYDSENKTICFTIEYLIQNGIIRSDSESDEYILNEVTDKKYSGNMTYVTVTYNLENLKLKATLPDINDKFETDCKETY